MTSSAHKQLSILHKSLYEKAYREAHAFLSESNPHIKKYASEFEDALPNDFIRTGLKDVLDEVRSSSIVLYGDFHTLKQSQKGLVRILRAYIERSGKTNLIIAMEAFRSSDQPALDEFLATQISEEEFLRKTKYLSHWGFPWAHYKLVLEVAKEHGIKVIGINSRNGGKDHLAFRDQFAARKLVSAAKKHPKSIIFCMIGESHLADDHLPKYLAEEFLRRETSPQVVRVLTNVDKYFFKLQAMSPHLATEYLKIKENLFCIINSPPWMKWQSYAIWEEMRGLQGQALLDADDDELEDQDYTEEGYDLDYQLLTLIRNLTSFLGLNIPESDLSKFHVNYSPELDFESDITDEKVTNQQEIKAILERVSLDGIFFLPNTRRVLLADLSINNTADAASQLLFGFLTRFEPKIASGNDIFFGRCLRFAAGMLGSKILNPRRKCPDLTAFSAFVKDNCGKHLIGHAKQKREAARTVLSLNEWITKITGSLQTHVNSDGSIKGAQIFAEFDRRNDFELSRSIGNMLGQRVYKKTMAGQMPGHSIKSFFLSSAEHQTPWVTFQKFYALAFLK